jgi:hypothetical protein
MSVSATSSTAAAARQLLARQPTTGRRCACPLAADRTTVVGGNDAADLTLAGLPDDALTIEFRGGRAVLVPRAIEAVTIDDVPHRDAIPLRPGVPVRAGDWLLVVAGDRPPSARRSGRLAWVATVLVFVVLVLQVASAVGLSARIQNAKSFGLARTRERTTAQLDSLRGRVIVRLQSVPYSRARVEERLALELLLTELDRMAAYIRPNLPRLSHTQLETLYGDLKKLDDIFARLQEGTLLPPAETIDIAAALKKLLPPRRGAGDAGDIP